MPDQIIHDEYISVGAVPIATPACWAYDLSDFRNPPPKRIGTYGLPFIEGVRAAGALFDQARKVVEIRLVGHTGFDGAAFSDERAGLRANRDRLVSACRPRITSAGQVVLRHFIPDEPTREALAYADVELKYMDRGAGWMRGVLDILIPSGVMRSITETTGSWTTSGSKTLDNPGTADQFASVWTMTAAQKITNTSYHDVWLEYTGTAPVTIDTSAKTAVYGDGSSALDEINWSKGKSTYWLPLAPGTNTLTLDSEADVTASHYAAYL